MAGPERSTKSKTERKDATLSKPKAKKTAGDVVVDDAVDTSEKRAKRSKKEKAIVAEESAPSEPVETGKRKKDKSKSALDESVADTHADDGGSKTKRKDKTKAVEPLQDAPAPDSNKKKARAKAADFLSDAPANDDATPKNADVNSGKKARKSDAAAPEVPKDATRKKSRKSDVDVSMDAPPAKEARKPDEAPSEESKRKKPRKSDADVPMDESPAKSESNTTSHKIDAPALEKPKTETGKKSRKPKPDVEAAVEDKTKFSEESGPKLKSNKPKTADGTKAKKRKLLEPVVDEPEASSAPNDDDHLHGFSTDEDSSDEDVGRAEEPVVEASRLPTVAKDDATVKKRLAAAKAKHTSSEERGVLYLGRIPHGFYEDEMRKYFSQFGEVTRLRLSRNKKTGRSKHYAFIEFESLAVAKIVQETMDNYLLLGHILQCKLIPTEEVHPELWVGANRKWRVVPHDRIARVKHNRKRTAEDTARAETRLLTRQEAKKRKLAEAGIDYDFEVVAYKKAALSE